MIRKLYLSSSTWNPNSIPECRKIMLLSCAYYKLFLKLCNLARAGCSTSVS